MKQKITLGMGILSIALAFASAVPAQAGSPREACKADVEKYCSDAEAGKKGVGKCLRENKEKLSEGCRESLAEMRKRMAKEHPGAAACRGDVEKFCKDVKPGEGRIIECLKSNDAQLSEGCKNQMSKKREQSS